MFTECLKQNGSRLSNWYLECHYNEARDQWSWTLQSCPDSEFEIFDAELQSCVRTGFCDQIDSRGVRWRSLLDQWAEQACFLPNEVTLRTDIEPTEGTVYKLSLIHI